MKSSKFLELATVVKEHGGCLLLVGGAVRDFYGQLSERRSWNFSAFQDLDFLVFGLTIPEIWEIFEKFGPSALVLRKVWADKDASPLPLIITKFLQSRLEISLPKVVGEGSKSLPFTGANLLKDALARDFTVNALYYDPLEEKIFDPLAGKKDLLAKKLVPCHEECFFSDPLRMLRAMTLISRKSFTAHPRLMEFTRKHFDLLSQVPPERLWREWRVWSKSRKPSLGLWFLEDSGIIDFFPILKSLVNLKQSHKFHPEGTVWNHTVLVVEALEKLPLGEKQDLSVLRLAALLHDVGKSSVTCKSSPCGKQFFYPNHAQPSANLAGVFLKSLTAPAKVIKPVMKLISRHMDMAFKVHLPWEMRQIARYLYPYANLADLWAILAADWNGRSPWVEKYPWSLSEFLEPVKGEVGVPKDLLSGAELILTFGLIPGPTMGEIIQKLREAQDREEIVTKAEALDYAIKLLESSKKKECLASGTS
ncbi:MAG: HD domain-containing protein [Deltaproteobacteria bacterium]|nr:HD domain-containing protein [Deltaproteobacteria bacterium]